MTGTVPAPTSEAATNVAGRPFIRELAEWRLLLPFTGRVLALQGSHPTVAAGIYDHSEIFSDPWRRAQRTFTYGQLMLFGPDRAGTASEIRELHRNIKGTGFDGRPYHAWNREAWTWVHLTSFEATIFALERIHGRLPGADVERLYEEVREVGTLYGVRAQDMPGDVDGLRQYVEEGIESKCTHRPIVDLVPSLQQVPPPKGLPVPSLPWRLSMFPVSHPVHIALAGSFPETIRRRWGIRWSPLHELEHRAQLQLFRTLTTPLPDWLRMLPYPYRVLRRSGATA